MEKIERDFFDDSMTKMLFPKVRFPQIVVTNRNFINLLKKWFLRKILNFRKIFKILSKILSKLWRKLNYWAFQISFNIFRKLKKSYYSWKLLNKPLFFLILIKLRNFGQKWELKFLVKMKILVNAGSGFWELNLGQKGSNRKLKLNTFRNFVQQGAYQPRILLPVFWPIFGVIWQNSLRHKFW